MNHKATLSALLLVFTLGFLAACASLKSGFVPPAQHPMEVGPGSPTCTECHDASSEDVNFQRYNHTPYFVDNHRPEAYQNAQLCSMCHQTSFCNDCHATRIELKPSIKDQTGTYRRMPHRGDYLSRHRMDGRTDPTSCFRCHGNPKTARTCASCHG